MLVKPNILFRLDGNGSRASVRHLLLAAVFIVLLALPFGGSFGPFIQVELPVLQRMVSPAMAGTSRADVATIPAANGTIAPSQTVTTGESMSIPALTLIAAGWIAGTVLFLLPMTVGLWQLRRIRRSGLPWLQGESILRELAEKIRIKSRVDLLLHDAVPGPMTCGILRPAIVFPPDAQSWTDEAVKRAMVHELEHVRRGDGLVHGMARVVCAFYWFHPLVWILWRRLGLEAERACDDAVLGSAEATEYADQLLTLARRIKTAARTPQLAMANRSDLKMRIEAVLDAGQRRGRPGALRTAVALTAALLLIVVISPLRAVSPIAEPSQAAQAAEAKLEFEVASVKRNNSGTQGGGFGTRPGGLVMVTNYTLRNIIRNAWNLQDSHIVDGPDWQNDDRWDINARAPEGAPPTPQQLMQMVRNLLADRFKLVVHNETREIPVYALVLARSDGKLGPQLRRTEYDCATIYDAIAKGTPPPRSDPPAPCLNTTGGRGTIMAKGTRMADFARNLNPNTDRIVIDRTGLIGFFDLDLKFTPDQLAPRPGGGDPTTDFPSLFVALHEQLGFKLEAVRAPVEVLVIDSAERATDN
jgi:bla regulator protein BlaR1